MKQQKTYRTSLRIVPLVVCALLMVSAQSGKVLAQTQPWTSPDANSNINNTNTGNVGIGTTTPTSNLSVYATTNASFSVGSAGGAGNTATFNFGPWYTRPGGAPNKLMSIDDGDYSAHYTFWTAPRGSPGTNAAVERMRITSDGSVGIGNTSPAYKLDVNGAINATGFYVNGSPLQTGGGSSQWSVAPNGTDISNANSGNVGIGTANPNVKLEVNGLIRSTDAYGLSLGNDVNRNRVQTTTSSIFQFLTNTNAAANINTGGIAITNSYPVTPPPNGLYVQGNVGVGTTVPSYKLEATGSIGATSSSTTYIRLAPDNNAAFIKMKQGTDPNSPPAFINGGSAYHGLSLSTNSYYFPGLGTWQTPESSTAPSWSLLMNSCSACAAAGDHFEISRANPTAGTPSFSTYMYISYAGNVGVGTTAPQAKLDVNGNANITGNINVTGNINAKYQDIAEWVPTSKVMPAGTVVVLDSLHSNYVISSSKSYDTKVAGVISAQPGIALGESGANKVLVATTGRVKVKVDATRAPIQIGDLLVTSGRAGLAMKSEPLMISGREFHSPGTLIGKALEPLEKGTGEILVLLSLQ